MWQTNKHFALKLIYFSSGQLQISDVIYLCIYLFIYLFIYIFIHIFIHLLIYLFIYLFYLFTLFNVDYNFSNIY